MARLGSTEWVVWLILTVFCLYMPFVIFIYNKGRHGGSTRRARPLMFVAGAISASIAAFFVSLSQVIHSDGKFIMQSTGVHLFFLSAQDCIFLVSARLYLRFYRTQTHLKIGETLAQEEFDSTDPIIKWYSRLHPLLNWKVSLGYLIINFLGILIAEISVMAHHGFDIATFYEPLQTIFHIKLGLTIFLLYLFSIILFIRIKDKTGTKQIIGLAALVQFPLIILYPLTALMSSNTAHFVQHLLLWMSCNCILA